ncbi:MAG: hypothetical protein ACR2F2_05875 [Pyrinomonadaceae bacterium]
MSNKTISKNFAFVISVLIFSFLTNACFQVSSRDENNKNKASNQDSKIYSGPKIVGKIKTKEIDESSGLAASKCTENVFWTHNDSGDGAYIFALDSKGEKLATYKVKNAVNNDWEDIAEIKNPNGECFLYIGDIGNNARTKTVQTVYRVKEPTDFSKDSSKKNPLMTDEAEKIKFSYPDVSHDAETLLVHPQTGDIYIITKRLSGAAGIYKLKAGFDKSKTVKPEKISDFSVPAVPEGFLTGGDISPDGRRVVFCDYFGAYEILLPENAKNFDDIWNEKPLIIELGTREQGEAIGYSADGNSIFATSENKNSPLIEVRRK